MLFRSIGRAPYVATSPSPGAFILVQGRDAAPIRVDEADWPGEIGKRAQALVWSHMGLQAAEYEREAKIRKAPRTIGERGALNGDMGAGGSGGRRPTPITWPFARRSRLAPASAFKTI